MRHWWRLRRTHRRLWQVLGIAGVAVLVLVLVSALSQLLFSRTWGLVPTSGTAMAPAIRPGGMMLCLPLGLREPKVGDIIVFRPWTYDYDLCRRVVEVTPEGLVSKGDGLEKPDQELGAGISVITRAEIHGFVPQLLGRPVWVPGLGLLSAGPGNRARLVVALAAASVVLLAPPARKAGRRLSLRKRRAMVVSRLWIYGAAATICVALTAGAMWWVGGWADIPMASAETAAQGTAEGPVDITVSPDAGRIEVSNTAPVALLVLAYPEPAAEVMVDRRFAVVPSKGSQVFGLLQGIRAEGSAMRLVIAPALVAGDWLYPLARELGACGGFVALSAIQFGLAAVLLGGLDLALAGLRR